MVPVIEPCDSDLVTLQTPTTSSEVSQLYGVSCGFMALATYVKNLVWVLVLLCFNESEIVCSSA